MIRITSITEARQNLPKLVKLQNERVVIVQNSKPVAVLISYEEFSKFKMDEEENIYFSMLKDSPSYKEDDEVNNFNPKDIKPLNK